MLFGARVSVAIGFVAVGVAITAGTAIGVVAGFFRGTVGGVLMGAMDVMLAFPSIILAIAITTILGPSITNLMIAVGIVYIPQYARLARASVLMAWTRANQSGSSLAICTISGRTELSPRS